MFSRKKTSNVGHVASDRDKSWYAGMMLHIKQTDWGGGLKRLSIFIALLMVAQFLGGGWYTIWILIAIITLLAAKKVEKLREKRWPIKLAWAFLILAIIWTPLWINLIANEKLTVTLTKTPDERTGRRLVYTNDETFEVKDVPFAFQFTSSDLWGKLDSKGSMFRVRVYGIRFGPSSTYRTIISADRVE